MVNNGFRLRKCPFYGGSPSIINGGFTFKASVECTKCGASTTAIVDNGENAIYSAVEKWNSRVKGGTLNNKIFIDCFHIL